MLLLLSEKGVHIVWFTEQEKIPRLGVSFASIPFYKVPILPSIPY